MKELNPTFQSLKKCNGKGFRKGAPVILFKASQGIGYRLFVVMGPEINLIIICRRCWFPFRGSLASVQLVFL